MSGGDISDPDEENPEWTARDFAHAAMHIGGEPVTKHLWLPAAVKHFTEVFPVRDVKITCDYCGAEIAQDDEWRIYTPVSDHKQPIAMRYDACAHCMTKLEAKRKSSAEERLYTAAENLYEDGKMSEATKRGFEELRARRKARETE